MAEYFTLKELCASDTAERMGIDNFPTFEAAAHLQELTEQLLDPLRRAWGGPIRVTSGYRCTRLNSAVGGVTTSAHKTGYASDLVDPKGKTERLIEFARNWVVLNGVRFDQLIRETDSKGSVWLHIGLYGPGGCQRGQILNIKKKS